MGLQNLPTEEQYDKLQKMRTAEIQKEIALERQATLQAQEEERRKADKNATPSKDDSGSQSKKHVRNRSIGWKPAEQNVTSASDDPMLQQMDIIRGYIAQAKQAQKWDEVNMLELNLKDLQLEYSSQQKSTWS